MKKQIQISLLFLSAALTVSACQQKANPDDHIKTRSLKPYHAGHSLSDASVIPSQNGPKALTTNELGNTTYGMGSSVYSTIGSSGLHNSGISTHLESRLSSDGNDDIRVFVIGDTVILAAKERQISSHRYDPLQHKVLSNTGGVSSRGPEPGSSVGTKGTGNAVEDNLQQASRHIHEILGDNIHVLTITGAKGVETIDRIRARTAASPVPPETLSDDLRTLLNMASASSE